MSKCCHFAHKSVVSARLAVCKNCANFVEGVCNVVNRNTHFLALENACPEMKWQHIKRESTTRDETIKRRFLREYEKSKPPTLTKQIKSFFKSMKKWAKARFALASTPVYKKRLAICKTCEFHDPSGWKGKGKCLKCGCCTSAKAKLKTEKCPLNKW